MHYRTLSQRVNPLGGPGRAAIATYPYQAPRIQVQKTCAAKSSTPASGQACITAFRARPRSNWGAKSPNTTYSTLSEVRGRHEIE